MSAKKIAAYGSWRSPLNPQAVATASSSIDQPVVDGSSLYWLENRPDENGRNAIVRLDDGALPRDVLHQPHSARSRVHEYGGACYTVFENILYFVEQSDQCIYRLDTTRPDADPQVLTPKNMGFRFADFCIDKVHRRLVFVCEQHSREDERLVTNFIGSIPLANAHDVINTVAPLVSGADFYAYPRISPDGSQLCWLNWNHPLMPWYGCELWLADLTESGSLVGHQRIAGGPDEALFQPQWSPRGQLFYVSDRSQWWNLYRYQPDSDDLPICPLAAEFATPLWALGMSTYAVNSGNQIACCYTQDGVWHLGVIETATGKLNTINSPYTQLSAFTGDHQNAWFVGSAPDTGDRLVKINLSTGCHDVVSAISLPPIDRALISNPQAVSYRSGKKDLSHAFYYPPLNPLYEGPSDALPPLIVICHGGPTAATGTGLNLKIQFWTSRGFAVLDINYRGSTGYGRKYREQLDGKWGISDVADVVAGANFLAAENLVDSDKLAIRGSSAGGYTVLAALVFHSLFAVGVSYYGISDLETLARDTHKFESRYLDRLIGPYPERTDLYRARSPINHVDSLNCPMIFFQGLADAVVPSNQAMAMVDVLTKKGVKVRYVPFADEKHGFRSAENIAQALTEELQFYSEVFNFELPTPEG